MNFSGLRAETLGDRLGDALAEALVDTLADTLAEVEADVVFCVFKASTDCHVGLSVGPFFKIYR